MHHLPRLTEMQHDVRECPVCGQEYTLSYVYIEHVPLGGDQCIGFERRTAGAPCTHEPQEEE